MNIIDRIKQIIDYKSISVRKFCMDVGVANGFLDKVKDVGGDKIVKILNAYPEINPIWLLLGEGEMLRDGASSVEPTNPTFDRLLSLVESQQRTIELQAEALNRIDRPAVK